MSILKKLEKIQSKEKKDLLLIEYPDGTKSRLNQNLVILQDISISNIKKLVKLHLKLRSVYELMKSTDDSILLRKLANQCKKIEFAQQKCWNFPLDETFHKWYEVPKCSCPHMDNFEMRGTSFKYINADCLIHGSKK
jgi:hypothetical protein